MEHPCPHEEEDCQHNHAMFCSLSNDAISAQDDLPSLTAELKMEIEKICIKLPSLLNVKQQNDSQRCHIESCSCGKKLSSAGNCIFDSIEAKVKVGALLEASLLFQLAGLETKSGHAGSASTDTRLLKSSELCSLPSVRSKTIGRRSSELNITGRKLDSCSSTNSRCSYLSTSLANSLSNGLLHCVWRSGAPHFVFSLDDDGDVYMANPQKAENSVDKGLDYVYQFCSRKSRKHHNNASSVIGKMKVSSSLILDSNGSKLMETEFVLFGCHEDYFKELESPSSPIKSKGLSRKLLEKFKSSRMVKHKAVSKFDEPNLHFTDFEQEISECDSSDLNESDVVNHFIQDFPSNLELAAIVVRDYQHNHNKEADIGGWGLKFLKKIRVSSVETSKDPSFSREQFEGDFERNLVESTLKMNVLIPADFHGGPITSGPSSLAERWQSGHCDCGGWDLGCPLVILSDSMDSTIPKGPEEECQSFCLFMKGTQHGEPTLRMVHKSKGLYHINFKSSLSVLQSFSIAVAIIHSREPGLYPKL